MRDYRTREAEVRAREIRAREIDCGKVLPEEYDRKRAFVELYLRPLAKEASGLRGALKDVRYSVEIRAGQVVGEYVTLVYTQNLGVKIDVTRGSLAQIGVDVLRRLA